MRRPPVRAPRPAALPLNMPAARSDPELEELVSIAVACARRAEDALRHAREISAATNRRASMAAAIAGCGVIAASSVIWFDRHGGISDPLTPVASALHAVIDGQRDLSQPPVGSYAPGARNQAMEDRVSGGPGTMTAAGAAAAPPPAEGVLPAASTTAAADRPSTGRIAAATRAVPAVALAAPAGALPAGALIEPAQGGSPRGSSRGSPGGSPPRPEPQGQLLASGYVQGDAQATAGAPIPDPQSDQVEGQRTARALTPVTGSAHSAGLPAAPPVLVGSAAELPEPTQAEAADPVPPLLAPRHQSPASRRREERLVASTTQIHPHRPTSVEPVSGEPDSRLLHARSSEAAANSVQEETTTEEESTTEEVSSVGPAPPAPPQPMLLPMPPPEPTPPPAYIAGYRPAHPTVYGEVRVYRRVHHSGYYVPSPPVLLSQVVANVRHNLYALFR
jgi:hypothetical protein